MLHQFVLSATDTQALVQGEVWQFILKWLLVTCLVFYSVFALVVTRQITVMRKTLITPFSQVLTTAGYIHFGVAVMCLVIFVIFL